MHVFDRTGLGVTYLDGVRVDSRSITNLGNLDTGNVFNIGQDPAGYYPETAAANIDDLGIRRRALTEYEALSICGAAQNGQSFDAYGPVNLTIRQSGTDLELIWQAGTLLQADQFDCGSNSANPPGPLRPAPARPACPQLAAGVLLACCSIGTP